MVFTSPGWTTSRHKLVRPVGGVWKAWFPDPAFAWHHRMPVRFAGRPNLSNSASPILIRAILGSPCRDDVGVTQLPRIGESVVCVARLPWKRVVVDTQLSTVSLEVPYEHREVFR